MECEYFTDAVSNCNFALRVGWSMYSASSAELASPTAWPGNEEAVQKLEL